MGLTQKLGTIPLAILTDASNNVGIGAAPSGSYKLEVTGTGRFSSTLLVSGAFEAGRTGGAVTAGDLSVDTTSTAAKVIIGRLSSVGSDNTTLIGRNRVGTQVWSIDGGGNGIFSGAVGIGTSSPAAKLTVIGDISIGAGQGWYSNTYYGAGGFTYLLNGYAAVYNLDVSDGSIRFSNAPSGTAGATFSPTERMRITSGGNVLIGSTTDNGTRLQVNGNISVAPGSTPSGRTSAGIFMPIIVNGTTYYLLLHN
jgi:hypothetical protein